MKRYADMGRDTLVRHPHDEGVWLGGVLALDSLPDAVTAVVSLCQLGADEVPSRIGARERVNVWLIDGPSAANPHLDFVMVEAPLDAEGAAGNEGDSGAAGSADADTRAIEREESSGDTLAMERGAREPEGAGKS